MDELISLVKLISSQKIEQIDLFNSKVSLPHKTRALYEGILNGSITNMEEGQEVIYGPSSKKKSFQKLQLRLQKRLQNTLFFLDFNKDSYSDISKARYNVERDTHLVNILIRTAQSQNAFTLAKKTYKKAKKFELTYCALSLARSLFRYYSLSRANKKDKEIMAQEVSELEYTLHAELLSEKYYNEVSYIYVSQKTKFGPTELALMKSYIDELMPLQDQVKSYKFNLDTYNIITSYYILNNEFDKSIQYCKEALNFFDEKPYTDNHSKFSFRNSLILSAIGKREYEMAEKYTADNFELLTTGTYNWHLLNKYKFILLAAQAKYQELYSLILDVTSSENYKKFLLQNEYWKVIEAYIQFLIRMEKIESSLDTSGKKLRPFSLARFLNDVPKYSKDKRGLNISILIIQYLFLLLDRKYSELIDRLDAMKQYSYRYLKNDESYRSNLFIKMLLKVADADFHPIAAERHTKELQRKLMDSNQNLNFQSAEIEVIPYEKLWEIVMELLEKNRKGNNKYLQ